MKEDSFFSHLAEAVWHVTRGARVVANSVSPPLDGTTNAVMMLASAGVARMLSVCQAWFPADLAR